MTKYSNPHCACTPRVKNHILTVKLYTLLCVSFVQAQSQYRKSEAPDELFSGTRGRQSHKEDTSKGASAQQESTNKEQRQPKYNYKKHHQ